MRFVIFYILFLHTLLNAQSVNEVFNGAANDYINSQNESALEKIEDGLIMFPENKKLQELKRKIEEEKDQDSKQGNQGNQEKAEQPSEDEQTPNDSGEQDGRNEGEKGSGSSDKNPLESRGEERNKNNADLQSERYNDILKSLKGQEQDTQRRLMMGKSKARIGRQDKDW